MLFGLASFPFARRYLGNRFFFLFLRVLRCFSSPGYLLIDYIFTYGYLSITLSEFPHSEICGSMDMCSLPQLIAAYHVLLRLSVPRHSPYALFRLNSLSNSFSSLLELRLQLIVIGFFFNFAVEKAILFSPLSWQNCSFPHNLERP